MTEEEGARQSPDANSDKKAFGKDVGKLVSGTVVAQVVGLLAYPVITRLFDTTTYGVFAVFISIVSILTGISCFRYEQAILLPKEDKDAGSVFFACILILTLFSAICIPIFLIFGSSIAELLNAPGLEFWAIFIPVIVFIDGFYIALRFWNTRRVRFGTQASTQVMQTLSGSFLKLGFGWGGWLSAGALICSQIIGQSIGLIILGFQALKNDTQILRSSFSVKRIKRQVVRYKKFPQIDMWSMLMHNVSWQLPVFMLTGFFSASVAGLYSLGYMVIQTPLSLVGGSIGQVFFQRASAAKRQGTMGQLIEDVVELMLLLVLLPLVILMVLGGDLFALVFGTEWFEAGVYVQILAIWAVLWFISNPIGNATSTLEIQEKRFKYTVANLITRFAALAIGGYFQSVYLAMGLFALFGLFTYGYLFYAIFTHGHASFKRVLYNTRKTLLFCSCYVILVGFIMYILHLNFYIVLALTALIVSAYYIVLYKSNKKVRDYIPI